MSFLLTGAYLAVEGLANEGLEPSFPGSDGETTGAAIFIHGEMRHRKTFSQRAKKSPEKGLTLSPGTCRLRLVADEQAA